MMRVSHEFRRHELHEFVLDDSHGPSRRDSGAIRDAKYMRVHCDRRLTESRIQHDVGGLASDARQVAMMFFALLLYRPIDAMYFDRPGTPSACRAAGVLATGNKTAVALFTLLSVACAERMTATRSSKGVE